MGIRLIWVALPGVDRAGQAAPRRGIPGSHGQAEGICGGPGLPWRRRRSGGLEEDRGPGMLVLMADAPEREPRGIQDLRHLVERRDPRMPFDQDGADVLE